jgi:hypothetical protein
MSNRYYWSSYKKRNDNTNEDKLWYLLVSALKRNWMITKKKWAEMELLGTMRRAKNTSYGPSLNRVFPYLCLFKIPRLLMSFILTDLHKFGHET